MDAYRQAAPLPLTGLLLAAVASAQGQSAPSLQVDAGAERHPISPYIYGMAYGDQALVDELHVPISRWGGDACTRYNWKIDNNNSGGDWFFMAGGFDAIPSRRVDELIEQQNRLGGRVLLTIPIIDYIDKAVGYDCSFPVSICGPQQQVNPYVHPIIDGAQTDAGNGISKDGHPLTLTTEQILRINQLNTPAFQREWVEHLVGKFGTTAHGGVAVYELDNEPGGWCNTHRDVHPGPTGHDELTSRSIAYAAAIKSADPSALVLGPGDFMNNYQSDGKPGDGRKEHGDLGQGSYFLQEMAAYEKAHGQRLLDYFDGHFYPTKQDGETEDTILESTRSLWDPAYVERNWIGKYKGPIMLIRSFHAWVDQHYPGTKVGISEYGWGDNTSLVSVLAKADVLGIFARERLDLACMFGSPKATEPAANAFRMFLNYDGKRSGFGDVWVQSVSGDQGRVAIYAAQRTSDHALTVLVINKSKEDLDAPVAIAGFTPATSAQQYLYSAADLLHIVRGADAAVAATGFTAHAPSRSIALFVIPPG